MAFHNLVDLEKLGYFLGKIKTLLNGKVDKEAGKGLSTNDYTTDEKSKLSNIASGAQVNVIESVAVNGTALPVASKSVNVPVPTKMSDLTNDGNYVSDANYVHTDNNYSTGEKDKLAGIASGAQVNSITGVKGSAEESYRTGNVNITKGNIGLGNVEDKSSETIRGELTKKNVTDALGYTPPETDTTYSGMTEAEAVAGTATEAKLISPAVLDAAIENKGYTGNVGTITGIKMNGASKGTSGVVDLGTVLTEHQDITGKADKTATVSNVTYDKTGKKLKKTINGSTSDIVTVDEIKEDLSLTKSDIGLGNVDNTSDANKPVSTAQRAALDLKVDKVTGKGLSTNDFTDALKAKLEGVEEGAEANVITGVKGSAESTYRTGDVNLTKENLGLGNVENTALSTWSGSANLTTSAQGDFGDVVTHSASEFAAAAHGTHVTEQTVKAALGTGSGTTKFLREDGTWVKPDNTEYESKAAVAGGTDVSLVTTGEKDVWNNKGTYSKPSEGIPADDLASPVQDSLERINTVFESTAKSGNTVTFDSPVEGMALSSLIVNIEPVQAGEGDPSSENLRAFSSFVGCTVYQSGSDTSNPTSYHFDFPTAAGTIYGCTLDVLNGKLKVTRAIQDISKLVNATLSGSPVWTQGHTNSVKPASNADIGDVLSDTYVTTSYNLVGTTPNSVAINRYGMLVVNNGSDTERPTGTIIYSLNDPIEYQLTPQEVKTLLGQNNIWVDVGSVEATYGAYIDEINKRKYEIKPAGIPKIDLSPDVQEALNKAHDHTGSWIYIPPFSSLPRTAYVSWVKSTNQFLDFKVDVPIDLTLYSINATIFDGNIVIGGTTDGPIALWLCIG